MKNIKIHFFCVELGLTLVQITIYFLNDRGEAIYEIIYHPLVVRKSIRSSDKPLKPNYSKKFGVKADDVPYEWSGKVKIIVSDIELQ